MTYPDPQQGTSYGQLATLSNTGTDLAIPNMATGLEDFTAEDLKLARLVIDQKAGVFKDSLSGIEMDKVHAITLGVVKQRVLWAANVEEDGNPLCKSTNYSAGYPTTWDKPVNNFPWGASGWQQADFPTDEVGRTVLPCESCRFTQWKTHPDGKKPWCSTQHSVPLLYADAGTEPFIQAIFTMQRSSMQASQAYFAGFMAKGMPAFSAKCEITLNKLKRGQNDYYVPTLRVIAQVDQSRWPELSESYRTMREFLTRPPVTRDESGGVVAAGIAQSNVIQAQPMPGFENNTWAPPMQQQIPAQRQPEQVVIQTPIATPVQQAPVVQAPVVQQAPIVQTQYIPQQPTAVPVATPVMATPVVPATTQFVPPADNNDDLPF